MRSRAPSIADFQVTARNARIAIRATPAEIADLQRRAADDGCSMSTFIRQILGQRKDTSFPLPKKESLKTASQLVEISTYLQYLIRLCEHNTVTTQITMEEIRPVIDSIQTTLWDLTLELRGAR